MLNWRLQEQRRLLQGARTEPRESCEVMSVTSYRDQGTSGAWAYLEITGNAKVSQRDYRILYLGVAMNT